MFLMLLKYWQPLAAAIATAALAWLLHSVDVHRLEAKHQRNLVSNAAAIQAECTADKRLTAEVSNDYQTRIAALNNELAAVKRLRPSKCVVPTPIPAPGRNEATSRTKPAEEDGVTSDALYDFAGEAEQYRLQLIACQAFITKTWEARGQ